MAACHSMSLRSSVAMIRCSTGITRKRMVSTAHACCIIKTLATSPPSSRSRNKYAGVGSSSDESDQDTSAKPQTKYFKSRDKERQEKKKKGN